MHELDCEKYKSIKMLKIRLATRIDCIEILKIYQYYVLNTAITFEYDVPSLEEIENRMKSIQSKYPYLVAEENNQLVGYAYANDFRHKSAYQWSPESTIYIHKDFHRNGIGKALYIKLFEALKKQGFYNVFGGVSLPNEASVKLHQRLGFKEIGVYENIGYKFGKWHSTKWFQLVLNKHETNPSPPKNISEIKFE
jgi:phosphinothricin acetyltransferase